MNLLAALGLTILQITIVSESSVAETLQHWSVSVNVTGSDSSGNELKSCINRELRALGDISVVSTKPRFTLSVVVLETQSDGRHTGYAVSSVILDHFWASYLSDPDGDITAEMLEGVGTIAFHTVMTNAPDKLDQLCRTIVADVDTEAIEPLRVRRAEALKLVEDIKRKKLAND
ncbi:MAG: hypothetical protein AB7J97_05355 [Steroidobacteraceae bacterium]